MTGEPSVEVFFDCFADPAFDARTERVADLHVFSRYPQAHLLIDLPCSDSGCPRVYTRGRWAQASPRPQGRFLVRTFWLITSRLQTVLKRPCLWLVPCGRASSHFIMNVNEAAEARHCRQFSAPGGGLRPLLAPALHGRGNAHAFPVLGDRPPGDIDAAFPQHIHNRVVRQHVRRLLSSIISRMRSRTDSEECASPPPEAAIEAVKK